MKRLFAGTALLFVVGVAGFLYRNTIERPGSIAADGACTLEAKICPDGSSVRRTGPSCEFSACLYPNIEILDKGVAFVVPVGYVSDKNAYSADPTPIASLVKDPGNHRISVLSYSINEGEVADEVILAITRYQPSDMSAEDFSRFETKIIAGKEYRVTGVERSEGLIRSSYFLVREADVLRFDVTEQGVTSSTDLALDSDSLPEHQALVGLLGTLQTTPWGALKDVIPLPPTQ